MRYPISRNLIFLLLLSPLAGAGSLPDVQSIVRAVDNHYNHMSSLQCEFTEVYRGAGMQRTEAGTLWLKKPGKMRWEYRSPKEKLFLSDGQNVWFYVPGDRQARKAPVRRLNDLRSPLAFLLGKTKLEKELQGLSLAPDAAPLSPGNVVLRGVPTAMRDRINQVLLEISPDCHIARIILEETDGGVTEYRFADQKEDMAIAEQRFRFVPPAGVEVVDGNFGQ